MVDSRAKAQTVMGAEPTNLIAAVIIVLIWLLLASLSVLLVMRTLKE
jgi:hypothetical protein